MKFAKKLLTILIVVTIVAACYAAEASAIELKTGIGVVEGAGLRLREKPNTDAEILANASKGDNVVIIREVDGWYLVDYNLVIGYMSKDYISFKEKENVELGYGIVETGSVNLRERPDVNSNLLDTLNMGETAYIIGFNCGWYKVQFDGKTGYIRSDLLALTEAPKYNSQLTVGSAPVVVTEGQKLVNEAQKYLGTPYVWGGTTTKGFDCSGYTQYVCKQLGYTVKRTAAQQLTCGTKVTGALQPGDLVFFKNTYATSAAASHVGIYIGNNLFIHAGGSCVQITSLDHEYYAPRYVGAQRIF